MPSRSRGSVRWLVEKEVRELAASRSFWLLLLVVGLLVGHAFITSVDLYAEVSGAAGGPSALSEGLRPLEGFIVPTFGAYDLAATLLFPFVVIRLVAAEKQTGALQLTLQTPWPLSATIAAKGIVLLGAWIVSMIAGGLALVMWASIGGHLSAPETLTVLLGYLLRGVLTIGIASAAAALAASAASAAIVALTITLGTWALDYVAAARGGTIAAIAAYTPTSALRVFEHGELRVATVLVLLVIGIGGLAVASLWLDEGRPIRDRVLRCAGAVLLTAVLCVAFSRIRASRDVSEDRRNSFPRADEAALASISAPLRVTVYLAAEDPRLVDLERGVLAKLRRTMREVDVVYSANGRTGLFERPGDHYGEIWYELNGKREMLRSSTPEIVLETIYRLAGVTPPAPSDEPVQAGYPLHGQSSSAPWILFGLWPLVVAGAWYAARRPRSSRTNMI